jgi:DNA-binding GntR family transcriptional regulator
MSDPARADPLKRESVVDALAGALRSRILSGDLAAGTALRETTLSAAYQVSRHTLRAALRELANDGLVQIVPDRGATVARLGETDLVPLFELRTALEIEACRLTLARNGGTLPTTVHECLGALVRACGSKTAQWREIAEAHAALHESLVIEARSPRIAEAYMRLATELNLFLAQLRPVWSRRRMIDHHRSLVVDLETTGDLDALRQHLADGLDAVRGTSTTPTRGSAKAATPDQSHRAGA